MVKITDIMLLQQPEQYALKIKNRSDINSFSRLIGEGFVKIGAYLKESGVEPSDIPFAEYPAFAQMTEDNIEFSVGFYTPDLLPVKDEIQSVTVPPRKIAVCLHKGNYNELAQLYNEMTKWIEEKGYSSVGTSIEHYYIGPETLEAEQITRIVMPLK